MKRKAWVLVSAVALAALVAGGTGITGIGSADTGKPVDVLTPEQQQAVQSLKTFSDGFAAVAEAVIPSVVTITSERMVQPANNLGPFASDPFFRRFFGDTPRARPYKQHGLGSGVIVDSDGYILTNNHVIRGADELTVILHDGSRLEAKVVGSDSRTDLAVLRVEEDDLPAVHFGDSDHVRIGEWVMAVGSPFSENLQATTTAGIVSAKGRSGMRLSDYEDFIQTDAAINPGNSGGPLVNLDGELVGINSAIASRTGGSNGIGFAIPSNLAMNIMSDLIDKGRVTRGWLGVGIQSVTPDIAEAMDLGNRAGILVTAVVADGPAEAAGVLQGDVIAEFNGRQVDDSDELRFAVAETEPGTRSELVVIRDGREKTIRMELGEFPEEDAGAFTNVVEAGPGELGLTVSPITPEVARRFELESSAGMVVTGVEPGSPAGDAGLEPGDIVHAVNRRHVDSPESYRQALRATAEGKPVLFRIERRGNTFFVALRPE
jgi:serine protease Do